MTSASSEHWVSSWRQLTFDKPQSTGSTSPAAGAYFQPLKHSPQLSEIHLAAVLKYLFYFFPGHAKEAFSHNVVFLLDKIPVGTFKTRGKKGRK